MSRVGLFVGLDKVVCILDGCNFLNCMERFLRTVMNDKKEQINILMYSVILNFLGKLMRAPMEFFEKNLTGRILNRYGRDLDIIDFTLPYLIVAVLLTTLQLLAALIIFAYSFHFIIFFVILVIIISIAEFILIMPTSIQLRRLEGITRSPVLSNVSESLQGLFNTNFQ